jgi:hypothetical protein
MKRGDLVLAKVQILRRGAEGPLGGVRYTGTRTGTVVGQVVGLPGETVQIVEGPQFVVNGRPLDVKAFQVPAWLTAQRIAVTLQDGEFFVVMEYQVRQGGNLRLQEGDVRRVSVLPEPSLVGRGLMRWTPVMRRAFLKNVEP